MRDAFESLKGSVLMAGEVVGRDLVNGSFSEEWMVLGAELREAIVELAFGRCEGDVLLEKERKFGEEKVGRRRLFI